MSLALLEQKPDSSGALTAANIFGNHTMRGGQRGPCALLYPPQSISDLLDHSGFRALQRLHGFSFNVNHFQDGSDTMEMRFLQ